MVHATGGSSGLPTSYTASQGSYSKGEETQTDSSWPSIIHALCRCGALILLFPFGAILLHVYAKSVRWHCVNQIISSCIAFIGIVIEFYLSTMLTKSQSYGFTPPDSRSRHFAGHPCSVGNRALATPSCTKRRRPRLYLELCIATLGSS
jgi:hypothetical protein